MSIEFRLDRSDHRVVEAFLEQRPQHVGVDVVVETLSERLPHPGLERTELDYYDGEPLGPRDLATDADRTE